MATCNNKFRVYAAAPVNYSSIGIHDGVHILLPNQKYHIYGIQSCVGLIIKKYNYNWNVEVGVGVHIELSNASTTHFIDTNFTSNGIRILNDIFTIISNWDNNVPIEVEIMTDPENKCKATDILVSKLKNWFNTLNFTDIQYTNLKITNKSFVL